MEEYFTYLAPEIGERVIPRVRRYYAEKLSTREPNIDFAVVGEMERVIRAHGYDRAFPWAEFPALIADIRDETLSEQRRMVKFDMLGARIFEAWQSGASALEPLLHLFQDAGGQ